MNLQEVYEENQKLHQQMKTIKENELNLHAEIGILCRKLNLRNSKLTINENSVDPKTLKKINRFKRYNRNFK